VKSFNPVQPLLGLASAPVELHRYDDGSEHVLVDGDGDGELGFGDAELGAGELGAGELGAGDEGAGELGATVGELDVVTGPLQLTPFRAKFVGDGLLPFQAPLKPNDTVPLEPTEPL